MYAGMISRLHEVTQIRRNEVINETPLPTFACVFSSDKGPEDITEVAGENFYKLYGRTADYFKYGQPLIQAHHIINSGGRIFGHRVVAEDATLANIVISAELTKKSEQKRNDSGRLLYLTSSGVETTDEQTNSENNTPIMVDYAELRYSVESVSNVKTFEEVNTAVERLVTEEAARVKTQEEQNTPGVNKTYKYRLFIITDNGRGVSVKNVRITPDYILSKGMNYCIYRLSDIENGKERNPEESILFSINRDAIIKGVNLELVKESSDQFNAVMNHSEMNAFLEKIHQLGGFPESVDIRSIDVLFGKKSNGFKLADNNIRIGEHSTEHPSVDISHSAGIPLQNGTNGNFGETPFTNGIALSEWGAQAEKFFKGDITEDIWDLDNHMIDFVLDANYPSKVKLAIDKWCHWRKDCFFFRDLGFCKNLDDVIKVLNKNRDSDIYLTPFSAIYCTTYNRRDNGSRRIVTVTAPYGLVIPIIRYYDNNIANPLAGEHNSFIISDFIYNSLNFSPKITPTIDQKSIIDDLRVNYASITGSGNLTIQSEYTSQTEYGPLSYINNVILTQMVIKAVRRYVPKIRFKLIDGNNFAEYKKLIEDNVLSSFSKYFKKLEFVYTADEYMISKKIFNAAIKCWYKDFDQSEIFDVYAIEGSGEYDISADNTEMYNTRRII